MLLQWLKLFKMLLIFGHIKNERHHSSSNYICHVLLNGSHILERKFLATSDAFPQDLIYAKNTSW